MTPEHVCLSDDAAEVLGYRLILAGRDRNAEAFAVALAEALTPCPHCTQALLIVLIALAGDTSVDVEGALLRLLDREQKP